MEIFYKTRIFDQKYKFLIFATKTSYLGITVLKNYCHVWNHHPGICDKEQKTLNSKLLWLQKCFLAKLRSEFWLVSYLKSTPSNLSNVNFHIKQKHLSLKKTALSRYFEKTIVILETAASKLSR